MRIMVTLLFLTLVLVANVSLAATTDPSPDFKDSSPTEEVMDVDQTKIQLTTPTQPPSLSPSTLQRAAPYFYRYRNDFAISLGSFWGRDLDDKKGPHWQGGFYHQLSDRKLRAWEISGEIVSSEVGILSFSRRWNHTRSRLRPFHKLGASLIIKPDNQFATLLKLDHYLLRLGAGAEYSLAESFSIRVEAIGFAGVQIQQIGAQLAAVWGF